jgi:hypothetical protein
VNERLNGLANTIQDVGETYDGTAGKLDDISKVVQSILWLTVEIVKRECGDE